MQEHGKPTQCKQTNKEKNRKRPLPSKYRSLREQGKQKQYQQTNIMRKKTMKSSPAAVALCTTTTIVQTIKEEKLQSCSAITMSWQMNI